MVRSVTCIENASSSAVHSLGDSEAPSLSYRWCDFVPTSARYSMIPILVTEDWLSVLQLEDRWAL